MNSTTTSACGRLLKCASTTSEDDVNDLSPQSANGSILHRSMDRLDLQASSIFNLNDDDDSFLSPTEFKDERIDLVPSDALRLRLDTY